MRISDWGSDFCSSDLAVDDGAAPGIDRGGAWQEAQRRERDMVRRPATQARFEGIRFTHRDPAPPASQFPPSPAGRAEVAPRRGARTGLGRLQIIKGFTPIHANSQRNSVV